MRSASHRPAIHYIPMLGSLAFGCGEDHPPLLKDTADPYASIDPIDVTGSGGTSGAGGTGTGGSATGTGGGGSTPADAKRTFGGSALVGYYYDASGIWLVEETSVLHLSWEGTKIASWTPERPLVSAGFSDGVLVAADSGNFTTLDADLQPVQESPVIETCKAGVLVSGQRFVCSPLTDTYYTYNAMSGELATTAQYYTWEGSTMLRVPGHDAFVTTRAGTSPNDYYYYTVDDTNTVVLFNESPYHGDITVTAEVGFVGQPATHLITSDGVLLNFSGADCVPMGNGCFLKDGNLGTLPGTGARYVGLGTSQNGEVYTLVDTSTDFFSEPCVKDACILQRVNVESRDVLATTLVTMAEGAGMHDFYLMPTPDGESVWMIASGRSIYLDAYGDSLPFSMTLFSMPKKSD